MCLVVQSQIGSVGAVNTMQALLSFAVSLQAGLPGVFSLKNNVESQPLWPYQTWPLSGNLFSTLQSKLGQFLESSAQWHSGHRQAKSKRYPHFDFDWCPKFWLARLSKWWGAPFSATKPQIWMQKTTYNQQNKGDCLKKSVFRCLPLNI